VKFRCYLSSLLKIRHPDCEHCNARETSGNEMRKRLEELNWRTQPHFLNKGDHREVVEVFDSKPNEVINAPASLKPKTKTA
jgi:collagenase-like PrtC family protease